jgi:predicted esterase
MDFTHRFIPAAASQAGHVLLLLHGTGGDESDLLPLGRELDPDAALLSPRGKVLENGRPRFFRRLAEGVFDEADVVGAAAVRYGFDARRVTAVGYSNGANIAAAVLLLRAEALTRAILFRAMVPLVPAQPPDLAHARILISSGVHDPIVPVENAERLAKMLREAGANVTLRFEAAGHPLAPGDIAAAKGWLHDRGGGSAFAKAPA